MPTFGRMKKVLHVVGARPNFMKVAPLHRALAARGGFEQILVHTGQHYDRKMSEIFFSELGLPAPKVDLGVGSGTQAEQTGKVMIAFEKVLARVRPDLVSVVGDVNSTLAAALVAAKANIPVAHVEAGLRSFDSTMPEEVNRIVTDRLANVLLTPSPDADENLRKEGVSPERIHFVGNVMIDTLVAFREMALSRPTLRELGLAPSRYALCTLHRPSNVDDPHVLAGLLRALARLSEELPVLFPVHPRTKAALEAHGVSVKALRCIEPLGYLELLAVSAQAKLVLTDSGGLQEETTALGVPCLTLRENTERPVTVTVGTNLLVGTDPELIVEEARKVLFGHGKRGRVPDLWDGRAAPRIAEVYARTLRA